MSWFAELAGKAESLLNNIDEQTGVALRNHNVVKSNKKHDFTLHPEPWQKRRPAARSTKKSPSETKSNNVMPSRNTSPAASRTSRSPVKENSELGCKSPSRRSPTRKSPFNLNHCPKTMVGDIKDDDDIYQSKFISKQRRYSLPDDVELMSTQSMTNKLQNLEVENAMLKNELNVMNREVTELLHRLRKTEDGNVVNGYSAELNIAQKKYENSEIQNQRLCMDTETQNEELGELKYKINELVNVELVKQRDRNQSLETEINLLKERNQDLEERLKQMNDKTNENRATHRKLENDLRHAQSIIKDLQANLEKSMGECRTLEKDWETYKLRVKGMLHTKDNQIKALQEGLSLSEDTKSMMEQLEELKQERESLSEAVSTVRSECADMQKYIEQLEAKHSAAERVVTALREALRDERDSKNRAEGQCLALSKELKSLQMETTQQIANLRTAIRDKEAEINNLQNSASTDTSALNVADYDVMQSMDQDRVHYLTETLVQKQGKIDSLLADNNVLRIQLDKLESKYKSEVISQRANAHVVHLQDGERRTRSQAPASALSNVSLKIGVMMRRYPVFRMFIVIYMICLHFWVLTVLFTSTPEGHMNRHVKS